MDEYYKFASKITAKITDFSITSRGKFAYKDKFRNSLNS
jgi:hypothetical protein